MVPQIADHFESVARQVVDPVVDDRPGFARHVEHDRTVGEHQVLQAVAADELYASGYSAEDLDRWAKLIRSWHEGKCPRTEHTVATPARTTKGRDIYAYFDNDVKAHAPHDAMSLAKRCAGCIRDASSRTA
ncbi:DUF72 domain-containing protein [Saccharopolyspora shandongensis]|uniref:DUF72 domain-containing protein n=1 Tax=Saccharopolyspora shandongensis TaxID=418495 RepID=UPI0034330529